MKNHLLLCALLFILFIILSFTEGKIYEYALSLRMEEDYVQTEQFRKQELSDTKLKKIALITKQSNLSAGETALLMQKADSINSISKLQLWKQLFLHYQYNAYMDNNKAFGQIWNDVKCFPVIGSGMSYENSWMFERTYGGKRGHEGTDIIPPENISGYYDIRSMTDGWVEQIGWLEKGGYRVGIRSPSGGYYYYAHLSQYADDLSIGSEVSAGEIIGKMGDTGYGQEGTTGKFPVHLHLGIYLRTRQTKELSVNPYWILRYAELE